MSPQPVSPLQPDQGRRAAWQPPAELLADLSRRSPVGCWAQDPESGMLWCDEATRYLLDLPSGLISWADLEQRLHADDRGLCQRLEQTLQAGAQQHREIVQLDGPGRARHYLEVTAFRDLAGLLAGQFKDISERHQLLLRLQQQRQLYDLAISSTRAAVWDWPDLRQNEIWWSPQIYQLLGIAEPGERLTATGFRDRYLHPEDIPRIQAEIARLGADLGTWRIEFRLLTEARRALWVECYGQTLLDAKGQPTRMVGTLLDIDARRREQAQQQRQLDFQDQLNALSYQISLPLEQLWQASFDILMRYFELPAVSIIRAWGPVAEIQAMTDVRPPYWKPLFRAGQHTPLSGSLVEQLLQQDSVQSLAELAPANPARAQVLSQYGINCLIGVPYRLGEERVGAILCFGDQARPQDFSPRERDFLSHFSRWYGFMLERFYHLEHLHKLDASKDRLLSVVAHDLRDPLGVVVGAARMLGRQLGPDDKSLGMIASACRHANQLIEELLEVGELDREEGQLTVETSDLAELIDETLAAFAQRLQDKGLQLIWEQAPGLAPVALNRSKIRRVLENLLNNALKFTPAGGQVSLRLQQQDHYACLELADTGIGIPAALLPELFDKFGPARRMGLQGERSTGLGMYIVHEIVRLHGGQIQVFSQEGQGTRFMILLPTLQAA